MTATQWLEVLTSYALQVLVVVAACKLLERSLSRAGERCALWNTCFICLLTLACSAVLLPRLHLFQPWSRVDPQALVSVAVAQTVVGRLLLAVWCIGASVSLVRWMTHGYWLRRMLRRCEPLPDSKVEELVGGPFPRGKGSLSILVSDEADGPFCWQLHQPTIVLPRFLLEGSEDDLRFVLRHELEHLQTNHPLQLFLQHLVQVICWFHPAVWSAGSRASLTREFSCDEAAANHGADSAAYLRTLLHIAERCEQKRSLSAIGFGRTPSEIVLRARRLVSLSNSSNLAGQRGKIETAMAMFILLCATCLASLIWVPVDALASSRSLWSPWPSWTAKSAHCFGFGLRDYEQFDRRVQVFEIVQDAAHENVTLPEKVDQASYAGN